MPIGEPGGHRLRDAASQHPRRGLDDLDLVTERAQGGRRLQTDDPTPEDQDPAVDGQVSPESLQVRHGAQGVRGLKGREGAGPGTGREEQGGIRQRLPIAQVDVAPHRVHGRHGARQPQLDEVPPGRIGPQRRQRDLLTGQRRLGQDGPVIRGHCLIAEEDDGNAALSDRAGGIRSRGAAADDDVGGGHGSSGRVALTARTCRHQ